MGYPSSVCLKGEPVRPTAWCTSAMFGSHGMRSSVSGICQTGLIIGKQQSVVQGWPGSPHPFICSPHAPTDYSSSKGRCTDFALAPPGPRCWQTTIN